MEKSDHIEILKRKAWIKIACYETDNNTMEDDIQYNRYKYNHSELKY